MHASAVASVGPPPDLVQQTSMATTRLLLTNDPRARCGRRAMAGTVAWMHFNRLITTRPTAS
jgi:hypothetical protein